MTLVQTRLIIALDEWLGITAMVTLVIGGREDWVPYVLVPWAVAVYGVSYPLYWARVWKEWR